jgi:cation diffusion facilitator CzcD-associated flavoprotein CzcO
MRKTVRKWDLDRDIQFNTRVTGAYWREWSGQWKLTVEHEGIERVEYADILISAQGFLRWDHFP